MDVKFHLGTHENGFYEIAKDIIIPSASILATLIVGWYIASVLRNREEKSKRKQLLIDYYMDFLQSLKVNFSFEVAYFKYEIINDILINASQYFPIPDNWEHSFDTIKTEAERIKANAEEFQEESTNWSYFTYRFAFLLGKMAYTKNLQSLENKIVEKLNAKSRKSSFNSIKETIKADVETISNLQSTDPFKVKLAIYSIETLVVDKYSSYQYSFFNPYNAKVAELIDEY